MKKATKYAIIVNKISGKIALQNNVGNLKGKGKMPELIKIKKRNKSDQLLSLVEIHKKLKKAGIEIEEGEAYNFYDCGCIVDNRDDPCNLKHNYTTHQRVRGCPYCEELNMGFLIIKYKVCQCGQEYNSKGVHASQFCSKCPTSLRSAGIVKGKTKANVASKLDFQKRFNGDFQDNERWNCFYRDNCAKYYQMHDAIPCLGCELYTPQDLDADSVEPRERGEQTIYM